MPRKAGYRHHEDTRKAIQAKLLINRLFDHSTADKPIMDTSQVNAAKALLNKVLPDLQAVSIEGEIETTVSVIDRILEDVNGKSRSK